jgi:biopolymer transport protein ExbD
MKSFSRKTKLSSSVDITPLLDVVFQLLLFFILTSALVSPSIDLDLPESNGSDNALEADLIISVDKEGHIFLNDLSVTLEEVESSLRIFSTQNNNAVVILRADSALPYGNFFSILNASRNAGINNLDLAYEEK